MPKNKSTQIEQVKETMRTTGGFARLGDLYKLLDFSTWKTLTPEATVRRIVQDNTGDFFKIRPGLWALNSCRDSVLHEFDLEDFDSDNPSKKSVEKKEALDHSYYQGLVVQIGNMQHLTTCVAKADHNRKYLDKRLKDFVSLIDIYDFTYPNIVKRAKTIDVIWFNERHLPDAFFEVEHTTNIEHSLLKFCEFQDFFSKFFIVAETHRKKQFEELMSRQVFKPLQGRVAFRKYDDISLQYDQLCTLAKIETI
jgi:hypothetical protein